MNSNLGRRLLKNDLNDLIQGYRYSLNMTKVVRLKVIPKTAVGERVVFKINAKEPLVKGIEQVSYICGDCGFMLAENIIPNNYNKIILQCPSCHALNDIDQF